MNAAQVHTQVWDAAREPVQIRIRSLVTRATDDHIEERLLLGIRSSLGVPIWEQVQDAVRVPIWDEAHEYVRGRV